MRLYENVNEQVKKVLSSSIVDEKAQKKFDHLKAFVNGSIKEALTKNFESQEEKISFLTSTMIQINDYLTSEATENSLKVSLIEVFNQIEEKVKKEEEHLKKTEEVNTTLTQEEKLEKDLLT